MKKNYNLVMEQEIMQIESTGKKPVLLLQCCCAPCSSSVLEILHKYFTVKIYYYNPNIYPEKEYEKRFQNMLTLVKRAGCSDIEFITAPYIQQDFFDAVKGFENEKEGGKRCTECFKLRLGETARKAKEIGADYFTTTLSVSPHKNSQLLNEIGIELQEEYGVKFLQSDFKKKEGYKRSIELSKQYELYRQNYCGCKYSIWFDSPETEE